MTKMVILEYQKCDADASDAADTDALYTHFSGYGCVIIINMLIFLFHIVYLDDSTRILYFIYVQNIVVLDWSETCRSTFRKLGRWGRRHSTARLQVQPPPWTGTQGSQTGV